jgi:hypothetical protein
MVLTINGTLRILLRTPRSLARAYARVGVVQGEFAGTWNEERKIRRWDVGRMLKSAHAISILLYGLPLWYGLLALVAAGCALGRRPLPSWFWTASRAGAVIVAVQVLIGVLLFAGGARPGRALHLLYGLIALVIAFALAGLREGGWARRFTSGDARNTGAGTAALLALTQAAVLLRAWMTGVAGRG